MGDEIADSFELVLAYEFVRSLLTRILLFFD
jgi:hypothetical protein